MKVFWDSKTMKNLIKADNKLVEKTYSIIIRGSTGRREDKSWGRWINVTGEEISVGIFQMRLIWDCMWWEHFALNGGVNGNIRHLTSVYSE